MGATRCLSVDSACVAVAESLESATRVAWHVACAAALERVDLVVVHVGRDGANGASRFLDCSGETHRRRAGSFLARVLQYLETPPCLRRHLVRQHGDLKSVGSLPPETKVGGMSHHKRAHETSSCREGVVVAETPNGRNQENHLLRENKTSTTPLKKSNLAHVGLETSVRMDRFVKIGMRVTLVRPTLGESEQWVVTTRDEAKTQSPNRFWGYDVRVLAGSVEDKPNGEWRVHRGIRYRITESE